MLHKTAFDHTAVIVTSARSVFCVSHRGFTRVCWALDASTEKKQRTSFHVLAAASVTCTTLYYCMLLRRLVQPGDSKISRKHVMGTASGA